MAESCSAVRSSVCSGRFVDGRATSYKSQSGIVLYIVDEVWLYGQRYTGG